MKCWHKEIKTSNDVKLKLVLTDTISMPSGFPDISNGTIFLQVRSFEKRLPVSVAFWMQTAPATQWHSLKSRLLHSQPAHILPSSSSAVNVTAWDHFKIPPRHHSAPLRPHVTVSVPERNYHFISNPLIGQRGKKERKKERRMKKANGET
jgi:hypothetical protein